MFEFGEPIFRVKIGLASAEIFQITKDNKMSGISESMISVLFIRQLLINLYNRLRKIKAIFTHYNSITNFNFHND